MPDPTAMNRLEILKKEIAEAFGLADRPTPDEIAVDSDWDAADIRNSFKPFLNDAVSDDVLERHAKSLPGFGTKAFVFFLKDYLRFGITKPTTEVAENLIYRLSAVDPADPDWRERLGLMSIEQKRVVIDCCRYLLQQLPQNEKTLRVSLENALRSWASQTA
jgi:hypothetical protein